MQKGMQDAGRVPLATTEATPNPTEGDAKGDVRGMCGIESRPAACSCCMEGACEVWEGGLQPELSVARRASGTPTAGMDIK